MIVVTSSATAVTSAAGSVSGMTSTSICVNDGVVASARGALVRRTFLNRGSLDNAVGQTLLRRGQRSIVVCLVLFLPESDISVVATAEQELRRVMTGGFTALDRGRVLG